MKKYIIASIIGLSLAVPTVYASSKIITVYVQSAEIVAQIVTPLNKSINVQKFTDTDGVSCYYSEVKSTGQLFVNCVK